jgi:hypothetical protein
MKLKFILVTFCIILFILPNISSSSIISDIPLWATGVFSGKWGLREYDLLTDLFDGDNGDGMMEYEIGEISGYYSNIFGKVYILRGCFYSHNNISKISNLTGICYGNLMGGRIGNINVNIDLYNIELSETNYGAIGEFNETSFNWRLMLKTGPTFYIKGDFEKF